MDAIYRDLIGISIIGCVQGFFNWRYSWSIPSIMPDIPP